MAKQGTYCRGELGVIMQPYDLYSFDLHLIPYQVRSISSDILFSFCRVLNLGKLLVVYEIKIYLYLGYDFLIIFG